MTSTWPMIARMAFFASILWVAPNAAWAHVGQGSLSGFEHGFLHPLAGLDHMLAIAAVGVLATSLGERALWALPATFMAMMVAGCALSVAGVAFPMVELGISLSVIMLGMALALGWRMPTIVATIMIGIFALFHGQAHGIEMPAGSSGLGIGAGFILATAMLLGCGLWLGVGISHVGRTWGHSLIRTAGAGMTAAGLGLATALA